MKEINLKFDLSRARIAALGLAALLALVACSNKEEPYENIDMTSMTADEVKAAIRVALDAGITRFKLTGPFEKTRIGVDANFATPGKNPFAGSGVTSIDFTGVTDWPDVDADEDRNADGKGLPAWAFGARAFDESRNLILLYPALVEVKLPAGVKVIGSYAFESCNALTTVAMDNVEVIGYNAFGDCRALSIVSLPQGKKIMGQAFACSDTLHCSLTKVDIPVATTIGAHAFFNCRSLVKVNAPAVTEVGDNAFDGCKALTDGVSLPSAEKIGQSAFLGCSSLTTLKLPAATKIGSLFLANCNSLTNLQLTVAGTFADVSGSAFIGFPNAARCVLTLNKDKKPDAAGDAEPKATADGKWYWTEVYQGQPPAITWKSIRYTGN